jgi:predicted nuclease of predicted toxin-antitoxin system
VKFLIDNQLPHLLATWFTSHGHEAFHVLDVSLAQAKDRSIWDYAEAKGIVLVTKDHDFSQWASVPDSNVRVVWVRLGNCRTKTLLAAFDSLLPQILAALESGSRLVEIR